MAPLYHQALRVVRCLLLAGGVLAAAAARADDADDLRAAVQGAARRLLVRDARLDDVAGWAAHQRLRGAVDAAAVRSQLWARGLRDYDFAPVVVLADADAVAEGVVEALRSAAVDPDRYTHVAVAVRQGVERAAACVLFSKRVVSFSGPRLGPRVVLADGYSLPVLYVTAPDGSVAHRLPTESAAGWTLDLRPPAGEGEALFELMVNGPRGPEVAALWPAPAGGARAEVPPPSPDFPVWTPAGPRIEDGTDASAVAWLRGGRSPGRAPTAADVRAAEQHLWNLVQQARFAHGLPELERHSALREAARRQAADLGRGEAFGHETSSGTALDRIGDAGLPVVTARENVGIVNSIGEAHASFLASPAHRANLLSPQVTHGGVGVVLRTGRSGQWTAVVSEVFAELADGAGPAALAESGLAALERRRREAGLPPLERRGRLDFIAGEGARAIVASGRLDFPPELRDQLNQRVRFHYAGVDHIGWQLVLTTEAASLAQASHAVDPRWEEVGVGVAQADVPLGPHPAGTPLYLLVFTQRDG